MSRVIICGSRDWTDGRAIRSFLESERIQDERPTIIHGAARGADAMAGQIARSLGLTVEEYPADWNGLGRGAGHARNRQMLNGGADLVVAFKDNFDGTLARGGTENMIRISAEAGIRTIVLPIDTRAHRAGVV